MRAGAKRRAPFRTHPKKRGGPKPAAKFSESRSNQKSIVMLTKYVRPSGSYVAPSVTCTGAAANW
jgi:hypothetical protein